MSKAIKKSAGRPPASPNKATRFPRNIDLKWRVSEGFKEVVEELAGATGESQVDVLHRALQQYAYSQPITVKLQQYIHKII